MSVSQSRQWTELLPDDSAISDDLTVLLSEDWIKLLSDVLTVLMSGPCAVLLSDVLLASLSRE